MNPKYVAYFFQTNHFHKQKRRFITGAKVRRVNANDLAKVKIPVPSLEEQARIVAILDKRSEEHTSELQSRGHLVCRLLLEKKKKTEKRIGRGVQKSHVARKGDHQTARDDNEHRHPRRRQGVRPAHAEGARPTHSPGAHTRN